ncbi:type II toxin-antitoxin system VapC family toxin [Pseudomonas fluorescens]|uniref:type II toxin-antitoxin system VapC family toxin n=1 Tax=Pseudomonas fluorescens TaxID=294 RepID=UPI001F3ADA7E|nr:hypothetical protein [Pseudomonas fluorescens]
MRIVLDTNVLVQVLGNAKDGIVLVDPLTRHPVERAEARADALIEQVDAEGGTVLIPTPALAEYLVGIDRLFHQSHLDVINGFSCFEIVSFDQIAAVECARMVDDNELKVLIPQRQKPSYGLTVKSLPLLWQPTLMKSGPTMQVFIPRLDSAVFLRSP